MVYSSGVDIMAKAKNKFTIPFTNDKDRFTEGHDEHPTSTGWGSKDSVQLVCFCGLTMVYERYNELVNGD